MNCRSDLNVKGLSVTIVFCIALAANVEAQSGPGKGYANIPKGAYSVVAEVRAKPGKADELRAATLPLVALVRSDPKNLVYFFQEDREAAGHTSYSMKSLPLRLTSKPTITCPM